MVTLKHVQSDPSLRYTSMLVGRSATFHHKRHHQQQQQQHPNKLESYLAACGPLRTLCRWPSGKPPSSRAGDPRIEPFFPRSSHISDLRGRHGSDYFIKFLFESGYKFSVPVDASVSVEVVVTRKSNATRNFPRAVLLCSVVLISLKASLVSTTVSTLKNLTPLWLPSWALTESAIGWPEVSTLCLEQESTFDLQLVSQSRSV